MQYTVNYILKIHEAGSLLFDFAVSFPPHWSSKIDVTVMHQNSA